MRVLRLGAFGLGDFLFGGLLVGEILGGGLLEGSLCLLIHPDQIPLILKQSVE